MSIDRDSMLERLKALPSPKLSELIFTFRLRDIISLGDPRAEQAMALIEAVESLGPDDWQRLESMFEFGHVDGQQVGAQAPATEPLLAVSKLPAGAEVLIGRDAELELLDRALEDAGTHIVEFVAWGGVGKSALAVEWMTLLTSRARPGFDRYFDWSFFSQGSPDQSALSADPFIAAALTFFGDPEPQAGSPYDRGNRLAKLVARSPTLLIIDGLEPLQYGTGPLKGQLKDPALLTLLKGLAQRPFAGLCVLTTREETTELKAFHHRSMVSRKLEHLSDSAGAAVLHRSGANRRGAAAIANDDAELLVASREVSGHALTLSLLGRYLKLAHSGDIDRRDRVCFEKADQVTQGGHAFRVVAAYESWLQADVPPGVGGDLDLGPRLLSVLRLLGLFDRPASADCLAALRRAPKIAVLTDRLVDLDEEEWNIAVTSLVEHGLLSITGGTLDAHPLVRQYFARQLRDGSAEAWVEGHRRLYRYLCDSTEHRPTTLEGMQPLYQAIAHGCLAGLYEQVRSEVYLDRVLRGTGTDGFFSTKRLGAIGADLGAVASFFDHPWSRPSSKLSSVERSWFLGVAAFDLRALGRLDEALEPMRSGLDMDIELEDWSNAATSASNLSELSLTLGRVDKAIEVAERSITYADRSDDISHRIANRTTHADALHQAGRISDSRREFVQAESLKEDPPLSSLSGFRYCDLLLASAEREAWRARLSSDSETAPGQLLGQEPESLRACSEVRERAMRSLKIAETRDWLLDIGLGHLALGRTSLYRWVLEGCPASGLDDSQLRPSEIDVHITAAVDGFREAGTLHELPRGHLTRAWLRQLTDDTQDAAADLDLAWEIAERGPMPLFQADILLTRARLLFREDLATAKKNLAEARRLIEKHGYHRRDEELEDAEAALKAWSKHNAL